MLPSIHTEKHAKSQWWKIFLIFIRELRMSKCLYGGLWCLHYIAIPLSSISSCHPSSQLNHSQQYKHVFLIMLTTPIVWLVQHHLRQVHCNWIVPQLTCMVHWNGGLRNMCILLVVSKDTVDIHCGNRWQVWAFIILFLWYYSAMYTFLISKF